MVFLHPREPPCNPCVRMSRSTVHRAGHPPSDAMAPDLSRSVLPFALIVDALDRLEGFDVPLGLIGGFSGVAGGDMRIISRRSDWQNAADRFDS